MKNSSSGVLILYSLSVGIRGKKGREGERESGVYAGKIKLPHNLSVFFSE